MTNLVFMFSNWYSGATLLAILLNNNTKITCNGETFPFNYDESNKEIYVCSCGLHMRKCEFYSEVTSSVKRKDGNWNDYFRILPYISNNKVLNKFFLSFNKYVWFRDMLLTICPAYRKKLNKYLQAHLQFYENACKFHGTSIYVDGTKSVRRAEFFVKYLKKPIKILYLIRDGRGFCNSFLKHNNLSKDKLDVAAAAWLEYIDLVDCFKNRYTYIHLKTIRYEDLCSDLKDAVKDICYFLGIDFEHSMIGTPSKHHMFGNKMRSNFNGKVIEDLSWKETLTKEEVARLNFLLENELQRFGYITEFDKRQ